MGDNQGEKPQVGEEMHFGEGKFVRVSDLERKKIDERAEELRKAAQKIGGNTVQGGGRA